MHSLQNSTVKNTVTCDEFNTKNPEENKNLKFMRKGNFHRLVLAHTNINSIRNKFGNLVQQMSNSVDIIVISEANSDNSFREGQFLILR